MRMPYAIVGAATSERELQAAMDALVAINRSQLESGDIPPLYESGVVYERETRAAPPVGVERFQSARDCYLLGHADCDGLAPWLAAEYQLEGTDCRARVVRSRGVGYHVLVEFEDGTREDPSAKLGMLDGVGVGENASVTARARRRRRIRALATRLKSLAKKAAELPKNSPQSRAIREALDVGVRELRGLAKQEAADREADGESEDA